MKTVVMSDLYPFFCKALAEHGYKIIPTKNISVFLQPEQKHADMQLLKIRDKVFTLKDCVKKVGKNYPENVLLNCLYFKDKLYGKLSAVEPTVLSFCKEQNIEPVNVNQGYSRCSTLVISDNAVITADKSIEKAMKNNGAEVLLVSSGDILLEGFDYGFIGGAGFCDNNIVYFFGNVKKHPDYNKIKAFCEKHYSSIEILCEEKPLTDIGGAVVLD